MDNVKLNETSTSKLDSVLKKNWVDALRSGEYKQGQAYLHNITDNTFCCLGVLCKINDVVEEKGTSENVFNVGFFGKTGVVANLPFEFAKKIGLSHNNEGILSKMNDSGKCDFDQIATYIEENL